MNENILGALRACIELGAQNPPGDLMLATGCSWRRILVGQLQLPFLVPSIDSDRHPNLECGAQFAHAEESIACTNLIRQHGPAIEQSLRSLADKNQALLRERELHQQADAWRPIESAPKDGTQILATWEDTWAQSGPHIEVCEMGDEGYWFYSYDGDAPSSKPTHWQPLPARPNGANGDVETLRVEQPTGDSP